MSYEPLAQRFQAVVVQVEAGLHVLKRAVSYLRKVGGSFVQSGQDLAKLTKHESGKLKVMQDDKLIRHVASVVSIQNTVLGLSQRHETFGHALIDQVVKPMEDILKKLEKQLKKLVSEENKKTKKVLSARHDLEKLTKECRDLYDNMQKTKAEKERESVEKNLEKLAKRLQSMRNKGEKLFAKHEKLRVEVMTTLGEHEKVVLPGLLRQLSDIEIERATVLKMYLGQLGQRQSDLMAPLPDVEAYHKTIGALNVSAEMKTMVEQLQSSPGPVDPCLAAMDVAIPCSAAGVASETWHTNEHVGQGDTRPGYGGGGERGSVFGDEFKAAGGPIGEGNAAAARAGGAKKPPPPSGGPPPQLEGLGSSARPAPAPPSGKRVVWFETVFDLEEAQPGELTFGVGEVIRVALAPNEELKLDPGNPGWLTGKKHATGAVGKFPDNYCERITDPIRIDKLTKEAAAGGGGGGGGGGDAPPRRAPPAPAAAAAAAAASPPAAPPVAPPADDTGAGGGGAGTPVLYAFSYEPTGDPQFDDLGYLVVEAGDRIEVSNKDDPEWWFGSCNGEEGYFPRNILEGQE